MCPLSWETMSLVLSWGKATHLGYPHPQHGGCVMISCSAATSHNPCWPWTHSVAEDDLICLSLRSYSDYRCEPPHLNCRVTGMEARASGTLGQRSNWILQLYIFIGYALQRSFLIQDGPVENGDTPLHRTATFKNLPQGFPGMETHCPKPSYTLWLVKAFVSFLGVQLWALTASHPLTTTLTGGRGLRGKGKTWCLYLEDLQCLMFPTWDTAAPSLIQQEKKTKQTNTETRKGWGQDNKFTPWATDCRGVLR